jgi:hypothetical protein
MYTIKDLLALAENEQKEKELVAAWKLGVKDGINQVIDEANKLTGEKLSVEIKYTPLLNHKNHEHLPNNGKKETLPKEKGKTNSQG